MKLIEKAYIMYRDFPPHVKERESARTIKELADRVSALEELLSDVEIIGGEIVIGDRAGSEWFTIRDDYLEK